MLRIFLFMGAAIGLLTSCSMNEQAIEPERFTTLQIRAATVDPWLLQVEVNETPLLNALTSPGNAEVKYVKYLNPEHRFRVTDLYSNTCMLDTLINYHPGSFNFITFFQPRAGANLVWVGPPANEPVPPAGKTKISVVYGLTNMPDQIKVVVENSKSGTSSSDYEPSDSFLLKKGEFSPYFLCWADASRRPILKIFTADSIPVLIATASSYSVVNSDFSVYSFEKITGTTMSLTKFY